MPVLAVKNPKDVYTLFKEAFSEWRKDDVSLLAAGLAYYGLFSLSPLVIMLIVVAGSIMGSDVMEEAILSKLSEFVGTQVLDAVKAAIEDVKESGNSMYAAAGAFVVLFIGAAGLLLQVQRALGFIWKETMPNKGGILNAIKSYGLSLFLIVAAGFVLILSWLLMATLYSLGDYLDDALPVGVDYIQAINIIVFFLLVATLFALVYKTFSGVKLSWGDVLFGSAVTAALFSVGNIFIQLYVSSVALGSVYGAASALVVVLFWIYYSAQIFLYGAELIKIYARKHGSLGAKYVPV